MSDEAFAELKQAIEDALAFKRGQRRDLKLLEFRVPDRQGKPVKTDRIQED